MSAVLRDADRLPVSTGSCTGVDTYDRGVRALPGSGTDTVESLR
jgi:hypothetical protein